jgi:hypothetical protein
VCGSGVGVMRCSGRRIQIMMVVRRGTGKQYFIHNRILIMSATKEWDHDERFELMTKAEMGDLSEIKVR